MKAYKIDVNPYDVQFKKQNPDGTEETTTRTVAIRYFLPRHICNADLGSRMEGNKGMPHKDFDLMVLGPIAQKIEQEKNSHVIVSKEEWEALKKRVQVISQYFGYDSFEMFRRVIDAEQVEVSAG